MLCCAGGNRSGMAHESYPNRASRYWMADHGSGCRDLQMQWINQKYEGKLLSGWTFSRLLYLIMGTFWSFNPFQDRQWIGVVLDLFCIDGFVWTFGCASGQCNLQGSISCLTTFQRVKSDITYDGIMFSPVIPWIKNVKDNTSDN